MISTYIETAPNGHEFVYAELTNEMREFLKGYSPADHWVTTREEMLAVAVGLNLAAADTAEELRAIRNSVVKFYDSIAFTINEAGEEVRAENFDFHWNGMMSVTAVIDNYSIDTNKNIVF